MVGGPCGARDYSTTRKPPPTRLKREDYVCTKHDPQFSKWKILIGPSDWKDYANGKEGATKYRDQNLPTSSGPGVYELGIANLPPDHPRLRSEVSKLDIIPAYLGESSLVRTRLQEYGRCGSHLGKGPALFDEIFSLGGSILYRWAPTRSKSDARNIEDRLLAIFDYAWNKAQNGSSRPKEVLQKLKKLNTNSDLLSDITRKIKSVTQKPVGSKFEADESKKFIPRIIKFMRSRPRLASAIYSLFDDPDDSKSNLQCKASKDLGDSNPLPICGMTLNDHTCCKRPAVSGRVRCEEHKGMKKKGTPQVKSCHLDYTCTQPNALDEMLICGVELGKGKLCRNQPVMRRKRCAEHKGLRVNSLVPKTIPVQYTQSKVLDEMLICGVELGNGKLCKNQPVMRRKRCAEHKGLRVNSLVPKTMPVQYTQSNALDEMPICGVELGNGKLCRNQPVIRRKRCAEHKGLRVNSLVPKTMPVQYTLSVAS